MDARKRKDRDIAKERSKKRLRDKTVNKAQQIHTDLQFSSLSISNKGWMGRRFDHDENVRMKRMWRDRTIESEMMGFQRVPFDSEYVSYITSKCNTAAYPFFASLAKQPATDIRDCEGRLLCKRSMWRPRMADLVVQFGIEAVRHLDKTDPYPVVKVHTRGPHRFTICGVDRNNKKVREDTLYSNARHLTTDSDSSFEPLACEERGCYYRTFYAWQCCRPDSVSRICIYPSLHKH